MLVKFDLNLSCLIWGSILYYSVGFIKSATATTCLKQTIRENTCYKIGKMLKS